MIFADKAIRFLLANKNPTTFAPALSRNITGSCRAIKRRWHEETEGLEKMKYLAFNLSPLPSPVVLRGVTKNSVGKRQLFNPPPLCFAQRNIGEVAEGRRG